MKCFNKQRYTEMISHVEILLIIIQKKKIIFFQNGTAG